MTELRQRMISRRWWCAGWPSARKRPTWTGIDSALERVDCLAPIEHPTQFLAERRLHEVVRAARNIRAHWDEILRLAASIKHGTVTASLMLRKLGSYPRQNGLAVALREFGRIERTLFILDWLQSVELRRRVHAGLNKGEARNALARAVFPSTGWEKSAIAALSSSATAPVASISSRRPLCMLWNTVSGAGRQRAAWSCKARRRFAAAVPLAAGLGAHQPDGRLPVEKQFQGRCGQVQVTAANVTTLTCFIFRFLK